MVRIKFEIENKSPFLRRISGVIHVEEVDVQHISLPPIELFRCKFHKDQGSIGFESFEHEGIPTKLFDCIGPLLKAKIYSYWHGMIMQDDDWEWVSLEGDDSWASLNQLDQVVGGFIQSRINGGEEMEEVQVLEDSSCQQKHNRPLTK